MKTFKQHIKEVMSPLGINTSGADGSHVGDGAVGLANIEDADVLKKGECLCWVNRNQGIFKSTGCC